MRHLCKKSNTLQTRFRRLLSAALALLLIYMPTQMSQKAKAATYAFHQPMIAVPKPLNFVNGGFEQPTITSVHSSQFSMTQVPGWRTYPTSGVLSSGWDMIELQRPAVYFGFVHSTVDGSSQYVEANANMKGRLNQTVDTKPGSKVYWQFAHASRARNDDSGRTGTGADIINFYLRKGGNYGSVAPISTEILVTAATYLNGTSLTASTPLFLKQAVVEQQANGTHWAYYRGAFTIPADYTSTELGWQSNSAIWDASAGNYLDDIKFQTGATLIAEKGIYNSSNVRIDGGYGDWGDIVSIKIRVTNWGETDAAHCVLTDTLWDGLTFVDGSVSGDGSITGTVTCSGSVVTANIGEGATASAGGIIKGSQVMGTSGTSGKGQQAIVTIRAKITGAPGSTVKDQAKVAYNDKNFESINTAGNLSYSIIDYGIADANNLGVSGQTGTFTMTTRNPDGSVRSQYRNVDTSNEETYVNQFAIINRRLDGTVWNDRNENGMIDTGESRFANNRIKLQITADGGATWLDASDCSGVPLTAATDGSGRYEFNSVPIGQYRVLAQIYGGNRVVGKRSSTLPAEVMTAGGTQGDYDNDAGIALFTDSGGNIWAVVQTLDKTNHTGIPNVSAYYTHNVDFGIVPAVKVDKKSTIVSSGNSSIGTSENPVTVLYGDTIEYSIGLSNTGAVSAAGTYGYLGDGAALSASSGISFSDTLPEGLSLVSASIPGYETEVGQPTVAGQTVSWSSLPAIPEGASMNIVIRARVTKPDLNIFNTASITDLDGEIFSSNTTYHRSKGLDLTITNTVGGDLADLTKEFTFEITPQSSVDGFWNADSARNIPAVNSPVSYTGGTVAGVSGAVAPAGGTMTLGATNTVMLKHGQSITIKNMPMDAKVAVNELPSGYSTAYTVAQDSSYVWTGHENSYSGSGNAAALLMPANNAKVGYVNVRSSAASAGDITLRKTVTGTNVPAGTTFSFDVTVNQASGIPRTGMFFYDKSSGGSGTLTLDANGRGTITDVAAGETVTIHGFASGDTYTITEKSAKVGGTTKILSGSHPWTTTWTNTLKLIIPINNRTPAPVSGYAMWPNSVKSYLAPSSTATISDIPTIRPGITVRVRQTPSYGVAPNPATDPDVTSSITSLLSSITVNSNGNLVLTAGSVYALINNTAYESVLSRFYLYIDYGSVTTSGRTATGMVYGGSGANFTNEYTPALKTLMIQKTVKGNLADPLKLFAFRLDLVTPGNVPDMVAYSYKIYTMTGAAPDPNVDTVVTSNGTITNGSGSFQLRHNRYIVISGLPEDEKYTVTELGAEDYRTSITPQNGTDAGVQVTAKTVGQKTIAGGENDLNREYFVNTKTDVPPTGIILESWPYFLAVLLGIGAGAVFVVRSRKKKSLHKNTGRHDDHEGL